VSIAVVMKLKAIIALNLALFRFVFDPSILLIPPFPVRGHIARTHARSKFVCDLKEQEGGDICVLGGDEMARSLFGAGPIDEIGFNIHPVLLGTGTPLFHPMTRQINLELGECWALENDCVYLTYRIKR
jgi:dihydrofolate reductase